MASIFPSLICKYSTFRNDLPFFVWQRYFTKASLPLTNTRSRSDRSIKLACGQHWVLKVLLLMWSSPAALVKVKLSVIRASN